MIQKILAAAVALTALTSAAILMIRGLKPLRRVSREFHAAPQRVSLAGWSAFSGTFSRGQGASTC